MSLDARVAAVSADKQFGTFCWRRGCRNMVSPQEAEVALVAHFMGYALTRGPDGYVLAPRYGSEREVIKAPTLEQITQHLKH
ncbi:MAG: hypothetical protein K2Y71_00835 [Xanthobacteraceae bacterium]|nr:hypothetical protein [Xanthobacteraceae bacterium]